MHVTLNAVGQITLPRRVYASILFSLNFFFLWLKVFKIERIGAGLGRNLKQAFS